MAEPRWVSLNISAMSKPDLLLLLGEMAEEQVEGAAELLTRRPTISELLTFCGQARQAAMNLQIEQRRVQKLLHNAAITMRMIWIEAHLAKTGRIQRADLIRAFGISIQAAVNDIARYRQIAKGAVTYDLSAKSYVLCRDPAVFNHQMREAVLAAQPMIAQAMTGNCDGEFPYGH